MKNSILYNSMIVLMLLAISINIFALSNPVPSTNEMDEQIKNEIEQEITENENFKPGDKEEEKGELANCPVFNNALSAYNYASNILNLQKNVYIAAFGSIYAAGGLGNQSIKVIKKIDGEGNIFSESVSKKAGLFGVNVADAAFYKKGHDYLLVNSSADISDSLVANYANDYKNVKIDNYLSKYKLLPWERNYDINEGSISQSSLSFNGSVFKCSMILNNNAVTRYAEKIKVSSDAKSLPKFSGISVSFVIDKKGRFLSFESSDSYNVNIGVSANVSQELTETYYYKNVVINEVEYD